MELRQIEAFVTAALTGNFTRAAAQLHLSQSAISQQIRTLEKEIGGSLFIRSNRNVRLSRTGKTLLPTGQAILSWRSAFLQGTRAESIETTGRLTVGTSGAATAHLWAQVYQAFAQRYPRIEMDIRTVARTQDTIEQVISGDLDVGFSPLPLPKSGLGSQSLGFHAAVLTIPAGHPLAKPRHRIVRARDLGAERFILFERGVGMRWLADAYFRREGITPRIVLESNDTHLIKAMVEVGFGIAFLPGWSIESEVQQKRLHTVATSGPPLVQELGLIYRKREISHQVRLFVEFCNANRDLFPRVAPSAAGVPLP